MVFSILFEYKLGLCGLEGTGFFIISTKLGFLCVDSFTCWVVSVSRGNVQNCSPYARCLYRSALVWDQNHFDIDKFATGSPALRT